MTKHYAFFYFMKNNPEKIKEIIPEHINYWKDKKPDGFSGGPFADRSGGMITFKASDLENATQLSFNDPFVTNNLLEKNWIKEWICN